MTGRIVAAAWVALAAAGSASAQGLGEGSVGFQQRQFERRPAPASEARPAPEAAPVPTAAGQEGGAFLLNGVSLQGATALSEAALADIWAPLIGTPVTVATLEDVAAAVAARYRGAGFVLSQAVVPAQTVTNGVVVMQVIEGFIDVVEPTGGDAAGQAAAARFLKPTTESRPLRLETLERGVLLTREAVGPDFETVLRPSASTFGAATLSALVPERPQVDGFVALDNRSSRLYGALTVSGGATAYNALGIGDQLEVLAAGAPSENYFAFVQGRASFPPSFLDGSALDGGRFEVLASFSRGEPDIERIGASGFESLQEDVEATVAFDVPFVRTRSESLFGRIGLTARNSETRTVFDGVEIDSFDDTMLIGEASLTRDVADRFGGVTLLGARLRQGIVGDYGATGAGSPDGNFTAVSLNAVRLQRLPLPDWTLYAEATAQVTGDNLPNAERFGLGGEALGRGFAPGNTTGDSGYGARLEVRRFVGAGALGEAGLGDLIAGAEPYAFGDYGQARDSDAARDGERWETLGSLGLGVRMDVTQDITVTPEVAFQVAGRPNDNRDEDRETRFFISIVKRF